MTADFAHDLMNRFTGEGMSLTEARKQFSDDDWRSAVNDALELLGAEHPFFALACQCSREESHEECLETQCYELMMAGWTVEPNKREDAWAWKWRRPARTKHRPGRLYLSTNQAYRALKRENQPEERG